MMPVPDVIERELVLAAPRSAVWAALTTSEGLTAWWSPRGAEVDLSPGGELVLHFTAEHKSAPATVVAVEPERLLAITWRPFQDEPDAAEAGDLTTRVEFRLSDHPEGTRLQLRETGFAALPGTLSRRTFEDNTTGWDTTVLPRLQRYLETGAPA